MPSALDTGARMTLQPKEQNVEAPDGFKTIEESIMQPHLPPRHRNLSWAEQKYAHNMDTTFGKSRRFKEKTLVGEQEAYILSAIDYEHHLKNKIKSNLSFDKQISRPDNFLTKEQAIKQESEKNEAVLREQRIREKVRKSMERQDRGQSLYLYRQLNFFPETYDKIKQTRAPIKQMLKIVNQNLQNLKVSFSREES